MTREERAARDELLIAVVRGWGEEWVSADAVRGGYHSRINGGRMMSGDDPRYISIVGVGRILSRLAAEGKLEKDSNGYMGYYRCPA